MNKAGTDPTTVVPRLVAQFAPPQADNVVAVIEVGPGETIEAARADFARMLGLTAQVNRKRCSATLRRIARSGWLLGTQSHGINSSMRFCGQPFTRRVKRSVK